MEPTELPSHTLSHQMTALIYDANDDSFKFILPSDPALTDSPLSIQTLALIGLMIRLNKEQDFVKEHLEWTQLELASGIPPEFQAYISSTSPSGTH